MPLHERDDLTRSRFEVLHPNWTKPPTPLDNHAKSHQKGALQLGDASIKLIDSLRPIKLGRGLEMQPC